MPPTRKRKKPNSPHPSTPSSSQVQSQSRNRTSTQDNQQPHCRTSTQEHQTEAEENAPPNSSSGTNNTPSPTDQEELLRAQRTAATTISSSYKSYLTPELSTQLDKHKRWMIAYPCKMCGFKVSRTTYHSSCGNLNKHIANCLRKRTESGKNQTLAGVGIKGTGDVNPKEVPQLCAMWCAEAARPFSALVEDSHQAILHPTVVKNIPSRRTVSKDVHQLYSAIQQSYKDVLAEHSGALYLGVDAWQSPDGFDILGIVIYRLVDNSPGDIKLEALPLDFI
ncbi:hypothetical protein Pst134EB_029557 [Puccinia striiformis f. sp. tritici]|nr:hypothetical protein Pst134EB_029557 [Puccinia striiformis f. sp. tritici]